MVKKKHNYTNENSKYYFIESLAKANPNVPIHNIIHAVENDISTPEMMIGDWNMYYNPAFYRLLEDKWIVSNKSRQKEIDKYPKIPYIKDKEIRLKKGRFNTGKISTNVLDSIWDSSKRVGIPFEEALGLAGRESTLGIGRGFKEGHDISPTALLSNWQQVQTVINNNEDVKKFNSIKKKADSNIKLTQEEIDFAEFFLDNERLEEESTRPIKENVFDNAFKYYMKGNYNRGDSRHTKMVQDDGKVLITEPAIQEWLKTKNKHDGGGFLSNIGTKLDGWNSNLTDKFLDSGLGKGLSSIGVKSGGLGGIANTAATAIGGLLAGKNKTGVGNALQGIGSLASNIPGVGGLIGAGVNLIGGITNAAFGSNINKEFVNSTEAQARQQSNYVSGATDNDSLLSDWGSLTFLGDVSKSDVGSDGWFSNKAGRETDRLNTLVDEANMRALASLSNTAENIDKQNDLMLMANYSAYGGPIDMKYTGVMSPFGNQFKDGGIYIKPSKRGTFTAAAKKRGMGVQEFASKVLANKEDYSPAMVKKANFARNASKWKHADGGELFTNGVTIIGNGGTHESNPYEGVQMGVDPQGIPNLVEEGEVIYDDYVFSNRLRVPKEVRQKYKLRGVTFADAAKQLQKESEERPNDPISKNGLDASMSMLQQEQEAVRMKKESNKYAKGGKLGTLYEGEGSKSNWLRYAPIAGHAIGAFSDLFSSPDYSAANAIEAVDITPATVGYTPVGNYLSYKPFDRDYYLNKLNAGATASRRTITNTSGGNRAAAMAGLLAADYNYGNQLGALARQAEEYNQALRERVEGFNRQTNLANTEMGLKSAMANAESRNQATKLRLNQAGQVAAMRKAAKDAYDARRSNNINVLLEELGGLGTENWNRDWLDRLAKAGVLKIDSKGNPVISNAKGGKIRTKKKKGFTYG